VPRAPSPPAAPPRRAMPCRPCHARAVPVHLCQPRRIAPLAAFLLLRPSRASLLLLLAVFLLSPLSRSQQAPHRGRDGKGQAESGGATHLWLRPDEMAPESAFRGAPAPEPVLKHSFGRAPPGAARGARAVALPKRPQSISPSSFLMKQQQRLARSTIALRTYLLKRL
jgi:hypothetical protein